MAHATAAQASTTRPRHVQCNGSRHFAQDHMPAGPPKPEEFLVPQSRDFASCICSSRRGARGARAQAMNADALLSNVASRLQNQVTRIQLYWFLCWWLVCGRPEEAKDDCQIVEDEDGIPW